MTEKTDYMGLFNKKEDVKAANESGVETSLFNEAKNAISKAELDIEDVSNFMSVKNRIQSIEKNFPEYDLGELKTVVSNTSALRKRLPEIEDKISQIENDAFEKHSQYFNQAGTSMRIGDKSWNNYQVEKNNPSLTAAKSFIKASNDLKSLTESIA